MDRWQAWLYETHPEAELRAWAARLGLFRFCRAVGGHGNDDDALRVAYRFDSTAQWLDALQRLGIAPRQHAEQPPQPVPGQSYRGDDYMRFPSLIAGTRWIEQPGQVRIAGVDVFAWCGASTLQLSIGADYVVTAQDVDAAEAVERALGRLGLPVQDPPLDGKHCICPKYYPDFFPPASADEGPRA